MGLFDFLSTKARSREVTVHDFRDMLVRNSSHFRDKDVADERIGKYVGSGMLDEYLWHEWKEHRLGKGRGLD
ncbi:hypothetical protein IFR05_010780 [Cadophora sp. M221]|nr:hypothetical protein IFR05_010780 [Cadophora sp. M221]